MKKNRAIQVGDEPDTPVASGTPLLDVLSKKVTHHAQQRQAVIDAEEQFRRRCIEMMVPIYNIAAELMNANLLVKAPDENSGDVLKPVAEMFKLDEHGNGVTLWYGSSRSMRVHYHRHVPSKYEGYEAYGQIPGATSGNSMNLGQKELKDCYVKVLAPMIEEGVHAREKHNPCRVKCNNPNSPYDTFVELYRGEEWRNDQHIKRDPNLITKAMQTRYLKDGAESCPYCRENDYEGDGEYVYHGDVIEHTIECYSCGQRWIDVYELASIRGE